VFSTTDTIVAIATPPGRGALGVVRLSGADALRIGADLIGRRHPLPARVAIFARLAGEGRGMPGDEVVATAFPAPRSSTGEDCFEISAHGSPVVLASILRAAIGAGARLAEPGEFSLRAFLNGKRDLVQLEAVADLVDAVTPLQARAAFDQLQGTLTAAITALETDLFDLTAKLEASLDFPDEGYHFISGDELRSALDRLLDRLTTLLKDASRGRLVREGAIVTLAGAPNVGKSSLFNALLNTNRAIVTPIPGTTRDLLTEHVDLHGLSLELVDTAGLRGTEDIVEQEGVRRAEGSLAAAHLALVLLDRSRPLVDDDRRALASTASRARVIVINKVDVPPAWTRESLQEHGPDVLEVSARTGYGLETLARRIVERLGECENWQDPPIVTNVRHITLLEEVRSCLRRARDAHEASHGSLPEEFLLADLQDAQNQLQTITGRRTSDDLLRHIFERFCIGK
jgi:tRNA modification GTPase